MYKNFSYCLWLTSEDPDHVWNKRVPFYGAHCSILTHATDHNSASRMATIQKPVMIRLVGDVQISHEDGFWAAFYYVRSSDISLPKDAHVSFVYGYNSVDFQHDLQQFDFASLPREAIFDSLVVMKCTGHFLSWKPSCEFT